MKTRECRRSQQYNKPSDVVGMQVEMIKPQRSLGSRQNRSGRHPKEAEQAVFTLPSCQRERRACRTRHQNQQNGHLPLLNIP